MTGGGGGLVTTRAATVAFVARLVLVLAVLALIGAVSAAPRSAAVSTTSQPGAPGAIGSVDVPARAQAGTSGRPLIGAPRQTGSGSSAVPTTRDDASSQSGVRMLGAPASEGTSHVAGVATYCAPAVVDGIPYCTDWGPPALVGAVPSFAFGDEPYIARVWRTLDTGEVRSVDVWIVSHCACGPREGYPTVVDLSPAAFEQLGDLWEGVILVELEDLRGTDLTGLDLPPHPDDERMREEVR